MGLLAPQSASRGSKEEEEVAMQRTLMMLLLIVYLWKDEIFFLCVCVLLRAREGIERKQTKLHFFHSFLYLLCGTVRPFPSLSRTQRSSKNGKRETLKNRVRILQEKLQNYTRRDSHSHTHALKTFTSSHLLRKKKRERERGTFHSRAFFSFKTQSSFLF